MLERKRESVESVEKCQKFRGKTTPNIFWDLGFEADKCTFIREGSHKNFGGTQYFFVDTCWRNYQIVSKLSPFCCRWPRHPRRPLPRLSLQLVRTRYDARTWWVNYIVNVV